MNSKVSYNFEVHQSLLRSRFASRERRHLQLLLRLGAFIFCVGFFSSGGSFFVVLFFLGGMGRGAGGGRWYEVF